LSPYSLSLCFVAASAIFLLSAAAPGGRKLPFSPLRSPLYSSREKARLQVCLFPLIVAVGLPRHWPQDDFSSARPRPRRRGSPIPAYSPRSKAFSFFFRVFLNLARTSSKFFGLILPRKPLLAWRAHLPPPLNERPRPLFDVSFRLGMGSLPSGCSLFLYSCGPGRSVHDAIAMPTYPPSFVEDFPCSDDGLLFFLRWLRTRRQRDAVFAERTSFS